MKVEEGSIRLSNLRISTSNSNRLLQVCFLVPIVPQKHQHSKRAELQGTAHLWVRCPRQDLQTGRTHPVVLVIGVPFGCWPADDAVAR